MIHKEKRNFLSISTTDYFLFWMIAARDPGGEGQRGCQGRRGPEAAAGDRGCQEADGGQSKHGALIIK